MSDVNLIGLAGQIGDHRVAFAPEVAGHSSRSPSKSNPAASGSVSEDWGFRFVVDPLRGIHYRVVRELELVCRFGEGARGGSGPSTAGSISGSQVGRGRGVSKTNHLNEPFLGWECFVRAARQLVWGACACVPVFGGRGKRYLLTPPCYCTVRPGKFAQQRDLLH